MSDFGPNVRYLLEGDVTLIVTQLQTYLAQALVDTSANRTDNIVTMDPPLSNSYFTYPQAIAYKAPAIFVIGESMDFRQSDKGANTIAALSRVNVTAIIEDRSASYITTKAFRYMAAMHEVLDQANLVGYSNRLKIFVRVSSAENSDLYKRTDLARGEPEAVFRKEIVLRCDVEHFENY